MSGAQTPEDHLEDLVDLGPHPHRLGECLGPAWEDHELLHRKLVAGVAAAVLEW